MVHLEIIDLEELYNSVKDRAIIANDEVSDTEEGQRRLNSMLFTTYDGDSIRQDDQLFNQDIESLVWLTPPEGVHAYMNPYLYGMLREQMRCGSVYVLDWLMDPMLKVPSKVPTDGWLALIDAGVERGINYVYENFDWILKTYFFYKGERTRLDENKQDILQLIYENRNICWTTKLPVPSKLVFVVEANDMGMWAETSVMSLAINAVKGIVSLRNSSRSNNMRMIESRAAKANLRMTLFQEMYAEKTLGRKTGLFRKNIFASVLNWTARGIISSIQGPHDYRELHIPWGMGLTLFSVQIETILTRRGFTPSQISNLMAKHAVMYHPLLDEIMQDLLKSFPLSRVPIGKSEDGYEIKGAWPNAFQRNPSLKRGSAQELWITRIKTDPRDNTIGISNLVITAPNADYEYHRSFIQEIECRIISLIDWNPLKPSYLVA